jgi:hypothetical protein
MAHIQKAFFSLPCPVLHRNAFPVVSEWCQTATDIWMLPKPASLQLEDALASSVTLDDPCAHRSACLRRDGRSTATQHVSWLAVLHRDRG